MEFRDTDTGMQTYFPFHQSTHASANIVTCFVQQVDRRIAEVHPAETRTSRRFYKMVWNTLEHWNSLEHSVLGYCGRPQTFILFVLAGCLFITRSGTLWNTLEHCGTAWNIVYCDAVDVR